MTRSLKADLAGLLADLPNIEREFDAFLSGEIVLSEGHSPEGEFVARAGKHLSVGSFALARVVLRRILDKSREIEQMNDVETLMKLGDFAFKGMNTILSIYKTAQALDQPDKGTLADAFRELEADLAANRQARDKLLDTRSRELQGVKKDGMPKASERIQ